MKRCALTDTLLGRFRAVFFLVAGTEVLALCAVGALIVSDLSRFDTELATISRGYKAVEALTRDVDSLLLYSQQVAIDAAVAPQVRDRLAGLENTLQSCASSSCHDAGDVARVREIESIIVQTARTLEPLLGSVGGPGKWMAWSAVATSSLKDVDSRIWQMLNRLSLRAEQVGNAARQATARIYYGILLAALAGTLLAALVALLMARQVLRPLVRLQDGMQRWSGKPLAEEVEAGGPKEIRDLAHSFNEMVGRVRDYQNRFEQGAEELFRLMMETSMDGFWIVDGQGRILEVNDVYCRLSGYSREEVLAMGPSNLEAKETPEETAAHTRSVLQSGHDRFETLHRRKDGSTLDLEISVQLLKSERDRLVCFLRDITDHKQAEVRLRHLDKMEALGRLTAGVVHEFNNLLTVVGMASRLAMDDVVGDTPAKKDLEEINGAVARASELGRKLLAFSRDQENRPEVVQLNTIVAKMEKLLRATVGSRVELAIELNPDSSRKACVDPTEMEQVLINLAINARDAMPNGEKLIIGTSSLRLHEALNHSYGEISPGSYEVLSVADSGTGMTPEVQAHLFEPFFTTKAPEKGTGLGLSIVHGIVRRNNGHIRVDSHVDRGTTFRIYLPAVELQTLQ